MLVQTFAKVTFPTMETPLSLATPAALEAIKPPVVISALAD